MMAWGDWDSLKPTCFRRDWGWFCKILPIVSCDWDCGWHPLQLTSTVSWPDDIRIEFIRNYARSIANSSNCGKFFYGLDATNPAVRTHVHTAVQRAVKDWKYTVLKIDFLYATCLEGNVKFDLSMSRAQAMDLALQTIHHAAGPHTFLIGCGCPLSSGIGFMDAMRVSADTGHSWYVLETICVVVFRN